MKVASINVSFISVESEGENKMKVSIIIPFYNVEKYLERCIDSAIQQTYENIEILCIDDGSTDHSKEIVFEKMKEDNRIQYFYQENGGPGAARNMGILNATGAYVFFLDSDDYLNKNCIKECVNAMKDSDFMSICGTITVSGDERHEEFVKQKMIDNFRGIAIYKRLTHRKKILESKILFPNLYYCEDLEFYVKLYLYDSSYSIVDKCLYYRDIRDDSVSSNGSHLDDGLLALDHILEYVENNQLSNELKEKVEYLYIVHISGYLKRKIYTKSISIEEVTNYVDDIYNKYPNWMNNSLFQDTSLIPDSYKSYLELLRKKDIEAIYNLFSA